MGSFTYNYLVQIDTSKFALLRQDAGPLTGLSGVYEERLVSVPSVNISCGFLSEGIASQDDVRIELRNDDGALNSWLGASDKRNKQVIIHEIPTDSTTPVAIFSGLVKSVAATVNTEGISVITVSAESGAEGLFETLLPNKVYEKGTFTGISDDKLIADNFGRRFPVCIGGTREHVPMVQISADPAAETYRFIAMHDPAHEGVKCRGHVNTIYRESSDGKIRVLDPSSFTQQIVTDAGGSKYLAVDFTRAQRSRIYADIEATECDTGISTSVKGHWLFRRSTVDEKNNVELYAADQGIGGVQAAALYDFRSVDDADGEYDDGPNSLPLAIQSGATPDFQNDRFNQSEGAVRNPVIGTQTYYTLAHDSSLNFGGIDSHFYQGYFKSDAGGGLIGDFNSLSGTVYRKGPVDSSAGAVIVKFVQNQPFLEMWFYNGSTVILKNVSATGGVVSDGDWHKVTWEIDRAGGTANIYIDDVLQGTTSLSGVSSSYTLDNTDDAYVLSRDATREKFTGTVDSFNIYRGRHQDFGASFTTGHSGQSTSAYSFPDDTYLTLNATSTNNALFDPGADDFVAMFWFMRNGGTTQYIFQKNDESANGYGVQLTSTGTISFGYGSSSFTTTASGLDDGKYHQVWIRVDKSTSPDTVSIFVDGAKQEWSSNVTTPVTTNFALQVSSSVITKDFSGDLDELLIAMGSGAASDFTDDVIRTQYMTATGNPARVIRRALESSDWGLGQSVDATNFNQAEDDFNTYGIRLDGALHLEKTARSYIEEWLSTLGALIRNDGINWQINFGWKNYDNPSDTATEFGFLDGKYQNVGAIELARTDSDDIPQNIVVRFFPNNDPSAERESDYLYQTEARTITPSGGVVGSGEETKFIDMGFVRRWEVADRIGRFYQSWTEADKRSRLINVTTEARGLVCGDPINLTAPSLGESSASYRVNEVSRQGESEVSLSLQEDARTASLDWANNKTTEVSIVNADSIGDFRYTAPPAPTDLFVESYTSFEAGVITVIVFTMPTGYIADEVVQQGIVKVQRQDDDTDSLFDWSDDIFFATPGETVRYIRRDLVPGESYNVKVQSLSSFGLTSVSATVIEDGITGAAGSDDPAGEAGQTVLELTIPTTNPLNGGTTRSRGEYQFDQRISSLESGGGPGSVTIEELSASSNTVTLSSSAVSTSNMIMVNGVPYTRVGALTGARREYYISGTTVTFNSGQVPDGTVVHAVYTNA